jgi:hypothetical protein
VIQVSPPVPGPRPPLEHRAYPRTTTSPASTSRAPASSVALRPYPRARPPCRQPATT